jgi:hypothetical protein
VSQDTVGDFDGDYDAIALDLSAFNALVAAEVITGDGTDLLTTDTAFYDYTTGSGNISASSAGFYVISDTTFANAAALDTALTTAGYQLVVSSGAIVGDALTFLWQDTSGNVNTSLVNIDTLTTAGVLDTITGVTVNNTVTLVGVDIADLSAGNAYFVD